MKKFLTLALTAVMALSLLTACGSKNDNSADTNTDGSNTETTLSGTVSTDGSTSMEKVINSLGESFMAMNKDVKFTYNPTGSGSGIQAVSEGRCDIGLSSRALKDDEKASGLVETVVALDGIAIVVNPENPVSDLDIDTIAKIYTGEITNWKEVGGADAEIIAYQRNETSGSQVMMENVVMDGEPMMDAPVEYRPSEMGALVDEVASYRNSASAIGYSVYYYVTEMYLREGVKLLAIDGVAPSNEAIASGEYPYTQYNYAVIRKDEKEDSPARQLFDFLTTPEGKALMAAQGYVPAA